jgi:hypothetical protein
MFMDSTQSLQRKYVLNAIILAFYNIMWFFHSTILFWSGIIVWVNHYSIPYSLQNIENKPKTCIPMLFC